MTDAKSLSFAGSELIAIVEGVRGAMDHGTWRDDKGMRLKDTNEWALFYTFFKAFERSADAAWYLNRAKEEREAGRIQNALTYESFAAQRTALDAADPVPQGGKSDDR